jgi:hypothetical protein
MATTWTMATAKRVMGVQWQRHGGRRKGHGRSHYDWREGNDGDDGDGDGARDMAACATTGERGIMVAMGHGFCVCFCVSGETTKIRKRAKL